MQKYYTIHKENIKSNPRKLWSFVNSKKNTYNSIPYIVYSNNCMLSDPVLIVNSFANHFSSVYVQNSNFASYSDSTCDLSFCDKVIVFYDLLM